MNYATFDSEFKRVMQSTKDTLKALINKFGGTISDEKIDQYPNFIDLIEVKGSASDILYDNTESDLIATNVQGAIDEIKSIQSAVIPENIVLSDEKELGEPFISDADTLEGHPASYFAIADTVSNQLNLKADTTFVTEELNKKANADEVNAELNKKANADEVELALGEKANKALSNLTNPSEALRNLGGMPSSYTGSDIPVSGSDPTKITSLISGKASKTGDSFSGLVAFENGYIRVGRYSDNFTLFNNVGGVYIGSSATSPESIPSEGSFSKILTSATPAVYDIPLASGIEGFDYDVNKYYKNQFGEVTILFNVVKSDGSAFTNGATIATLPAGYRPKFEITFLPSVSFEDSSGSFTRKDLPFIRLRTDGSIRIYSYFGVTQVSGTITFLSA